MSFLCPFLYNNILLLYLVSQGGPGQESDAPTSRVPGCFQMLPAGSYSPPHNFSAAAGVTVPGVKLRSGTVTASSLHCSLASSSHPTCPSALCCSDCISEQQPPVPLTAMAPVPCPQSSLLQQELYKEPQQPQVMASQPDRRATSYQLFNICSVLCTPLQLEDILCDVSRFGCGAT